MYKVFFNGRVITIVAPGKITLRKSSEIIDSLEDIRAVKKWFLEYLKSGGSEVFLVHDSPKIFFKKIFCKAFKKVKAAGGLVVRNNKILIILRHNRWDLPKGKVEKGETSKIAAIREVAEECGIKGHKIKKKLPSTYHIYQSPYAEIKGKWIVKETIWYEMEYSGQYNGIPQLEEDITEVRWFDKGELQKVISNTYPNLKPVISLYLA